MPPQRIETDGITLSVSVEGPEDGRPVLLLHGFPDSANIWRHQVAALTAAGFRTIAPDQRGYRESDAPAEVEAYAVPNLAMDAVGGSRSSRWATRPRSSTTPASSRSR